MRILLLLASCFILLVGCEDKTAELALGTLERDQITFTATSNEIIRALPLREGDQVKMGDVLVKLDDKKQRAMLAQAQAEYARAKAQLLLLTNGERSEDIAAAKAKSDRAKANLIAAEKNYTRTNKLFSQGLVSVAERDSQLAAKDAAAGTYHSENEDLTKLISGARIENISAAQAQVDIAQAKLRLEQQILDELTIIATREGILDSLPYHLGERVPKGALLALIEAGGSPYARVYIPASSRLNFSISSQATVFVDGLKDPFEGTVRWIATAPSFTPYFALTEHERSRLMYLAEVSLPESAEALPSGIPAQVDLNNPRRGSND